jgi:FAD-dependent urate hydroxylase
LREGFNLKKYNIAIVGGGIGGLCAALSLQQTGHTVNLYEAAYELKPLGAGLGVGSNSLQALTKMGVGQDILNKGNILNKITFHKHSGQRLNEINFAHLSEKFGVENITIHRAHLQSVLLDNLFPGTVHLNKKCIDFSQTSQGVSLRFEDGDFTQTDLVVAADGIHSFFRKKLLNQAHERYAGYTCWRAVVTVEPKVLQPDISTETWGENGRFGVVPLAQKQVYWFACINAKRNDKVKANYTVKDLASIFKDYHSPIPELILLTKNEDLIHDDILDIQPISQFIFQNVILLGDAAHATTPNMGQGAGQSMEDALYLSNCIAHYHDLSTALQAYQAERVQRTKKVITLSRQIGYAAQWEQLWLRTLRDNLFKIVPSSLLSQRLKFLYDINLDISSWQ